MSSITIQAKSNKETAMLIESLLDDASRRMTHFIHDWDNIPAPDQIAIWHKIIPDLKHIVELAEKGGS